MNPRSMIPGLALGLAVLALPPNASAAEGFARESSTLRAGPSFNYPRVAHVSRGVPLEVFGCLKHYTWCDVSFKSDHGGDRGWYPGGSIDLLRGSRRVHLADNAPALGLSTLSFGLDDDWGSYYGDRPWVH
ncbi:MAG: hypothetical protein GC191_06180 [Azospirillum sp.]|nr:hypothetical protein [Azospirillum sp.]